MLLPHKISARSLRAMAVIMAKLYGDSLNSHALACDLHWRQSRLHTRICSDFNAALSRLSPHYCTLGDESIIPDSSFRPHSTWWDAGCPTFLQILCPPLDTAALFNTSLSCVPDTCRPSVDLRSETKLSSALLWSASRSLSPLYPSNCHSLFGRRGTHTTILLRSSRFLQ